MKQEQIVQVYKIINKLRNEKVKLPLDISYKFFLLLEDLKPYISFQESQEKEIFSKYQIEVLEDGTFKFNSDEEEKNFTEEIMRLADEINNKEIENYDVKKPTIPLSTKLDLPIDDIIVLKDFINFTEE
jgi:hypothetical protein